MFRYFAAIVLYLAIPFAIGACSHASGGPAAPAFVDPANGGITDPPAENRYATADENKDIIIKAAHNTVKIKRDADVSGFRDKVNIRAARNEHEAFQIIPIPGRGQYLTGVQVGVSDLKGPQGELFSRYNFSYYLEAYVYCSTPSDKGGDTGWFPDPLVPITNPFTLDMTIGLQPIWIDCYIPESTAAGVYTGNVVVTADGGLMESIPLRLKVLDLTLGDEFRLKTAFGLNRECINDYHGYDPGENSPEIDLIRAKYAGTLLENGVSFWGLDWFKPAYVVNPDDTVTVDFSHVEDIIDEYLLGIKYKMSTFQFPLRMWDLTSSRLASGTTVGSDAWKKRVRSYVEGCSEYMESRGILDRGFMFIIDEPASYKEYAQIRYIGNLIRDIDPKPEFMVTEQPYSSNYEEWGTLLGYVDIFCPIIYKVEPEPGIDPEDPFLSGPHEYESWVYTNANMSPYLGYAIDHPALEPRLMAWLCYQQGISGVLYWSANYWKFANPWDDPYTLGDPIYGAGTGSLMYPGMYISEYTGQANIDGPISSIRLEQVREGLEDYEYLMAIGGGGEIPEIEMVISGFTEYLTDGSLFYWLRNIGTEFFFGGD